MDDDAVLMGNLAATTHGSCVVIPAPSFDPVLTLEAVAAGGDGRAGRAAPGGEGDAQVIGVPDPVYGEELMAWVRLRPGAARLSAESLRAYCEGKLAHYKIPRYLHVVDEFPMTVTGKVRKVEMREMARSILGTHGA